MSYFGDIPVDGIVLEDIKKEQLEYIDVRQN